jgi:predicted XRE-type DNA-binding protein
MTMEPTEREFITMDSGNIYADLGLPDADEMLIKAQIVGRIGAAMKARGLTQAAAAKLVGMPQPQVSLMLRGRFREFTIDRMVKALNAIEPSTRVQVTFSTGAHDDARAV